MDSSDSGYGQVTGSCEHSIEPRVPQKRGIS